MTPCPIFLKPFCLGTSKHGRARDGKIRCMALYRNVLGMFIIMFTTIASNKQFWMLIAADQSTVHHHWKSLDTNGHCVQTNQQKKMVDTPK